MKNTNFIKDSSHKVVLMPIHKTKTFKMEKLIVPLLKTLKMWIKLMKSQNKIIVICKTENRNRQIYMTWLSSRAMKRYLCKNNKF